MSTNHIVSSGYTIVSSGNAMENATVLSGGVMILRGGRALNTNVSGGYLWISSGEATDTHLLGENTYVGCISSGAIASRTSATGNNSYETIRSGGTSLDGEFYNGTYQILAEGGLATGTLLSGGSVIQRGGRLLNAKVYSGYVWISSGEAIDTYLLGENTYVGCISSGAITSRTSATGNNSYETIRSGGTSLDGEFHSGTYQLIRDGGVVSNVTILDGANQYISSGAVIKGDIELWGNMYGRGTAYASEATVHLHQGGGRIYNYDNLSGLSITFDADLSDVKGYYVLASGCSDFTGSFTVRNEDGQSAFQLQTNQEIVYNGRNYLLRNAGTNLILLVTNPSPFGFGTYSETAWDDGQRALITHFAGLDRNSFSLVNDVYFYYNDAVVDAEKVDSTELDDNGCGEAAGTNMLFMTGWAQKAGYESEDQLYKEFYMIDGTANYGWLSVMKHVFNQLPNYSIWNYYNDLTVNATLFKTIEERLRNKEAVCILYNHGTPSSHEGNHALTVWGLVYDETVPANDPRHYTAMIVSDSDDNKHGYATAQEAPNRLKTVALNWNSSEQVYYCDDGYIVSAAALSLAPDVQLHTFGNTEHSVFSISDTTYGFLVGVSGITYQDFSPSTSYSHGYDEYVNENIIDAEKYNASNVDDYWCQVLTNVNQLVYGGWAQKAGYPDEDVLALELLENPSILDEYNTSWEYLFAKLPQYRLDDYTHMFRMVDNNGVSLNNVNTMAEVDAYMKASNSSVYLQLDWGNYGAKTGSHAITMYGFTYDLSYSPNDPRYYNGVIISDSDNNKKGSQSGNRAPNSLTIIPIEWNAENKIYSIFSPQPGYIRFFWGLDNMPESEAPMDTFANGSKDALSWKIAGASRYVVEYSTDNFVHVIALTTSQTGLDSLNLPEGTYQWRVRSEDADKWMRGENIISDNSSTIPKVISSIANGKGDVFFATANGTWDKNYAAKHVGAGDWDGTNEECSITGKNRFQNLFFGSTDSSILLLTDDANGDALFVDDIHTELPGTISQQQSRIARIQEIRAGDGDDVVDMTSQRFEYIGDDLTIRGGSGNDTLWANKGNNNLFGDAGNDRLVGASGNDLLAGGTGNDSMHGGGGSDIFAFCNNWGTDTVEQLADGNVTLWFASGNRANWNASTLTYVNGNNSVKVSGVTAAKVSLKFGNDGTELYAMLSANGAFADISTEKIFESKNAGFLAAL